MPPRKVTWSTNAESSKYITDEMLAPFVSNFLPTSQVELTLSGQNLINADIITKSGKFSKSCFPSEGASFFLLKASPATIHFYICDDKKIAPKIK